MSEKIIKKIDWQPENPVGLTVKETGADATHNFEKTVAVWFQGQNYLYLWEIESFIKALREAKKEMEKYVKHQK